MCSCRTPISGASNVLTHDILPTHEWWTPPSFSWLIPPPTSLLCPGIQQVTANSTWIYHTSFFRYKNQYLTHHYHSLTTLTRKTIMVSESNNPAQRNTLPLRPSMPRPLPQENDPFLFTSNKTIISTSYVMNRFLSDPSPVTLPRTLILPSSPSRDLQQSVVIAQSTVSIPSLFQPFFYGNRCWSATSID